MFGNERFTSISYARSVTWVQKFRNLKLWNANLR